VVLDQRPRSPHLQIYRWQITMWLSSLHRVTGLLLSFGALALACWLISIASGRAAFDHVQAWYGAAWFKVPLIVWTACFFLHLSNGVRHLAWDTGAGFEKPTIWKSGLSVLLVTVVATAAVTFFAIL
jgi:succinate dehydrogenase / fumarate reductase cytochrome b subunit